MHHTIDESLIDEAGVEIEPMQLLEEHEDEAGDATWDMLSSNLWGIADDDVQSEQ